MGNSPPWRKGINRRKLLGNVFERIKIKVNPRIYLGNITLPNFGGNNMGKDSPGISPGINSWYIPFTISKGNEFTLNLSEG